MCARACVHFSLLETIIFFQILRLEKAFKTSNNAGGEADFRSSWTLDNSEMHGFHRFVCACSRHAWRSSPEVWQHFYSWYLELEPDGINTENRYSPSYSIQNPQTLRRTKMDTPLLLGLIIIELQIIHLLVRNGSGFICDCKKNGNESQRWITNTAAFSDVRAVEGKISPLKE